MHFISEELVKLRQAQFLCEAENERLAAEVGRASRHASLRLRRAGRKDRA
jgi:hypothetical protein